MKNTWPYMAWVTPISRTRPARSAKTSDSCLGRPKSLTSIAPATLTRSVMVEPMAEHLGAQVIDQALADPRGIPAGDEAEGGVEHGDSRDRGGDTDHDRLAMTKDALVDDHPQQQWIHHCDERVEDSSGQEEG